MTGGSGGIALPPTPPPIGGNAPCADTLRTHTLIRRRRDGGTLTPTVTHTQHTYARKGGWDALKVAYVSERETAAQNCVRRVRRHKRLSAQLLSEWPTHCELSALTAIQKQVSEGIKQNSPWRVADVPRAPSCSKCSTMTPNDNAKWSTGHTDILKNGVLHGSLSCHVKRIHAYAK